MGLEKVADVFFRRLTGQKELPTTTFQLHAIFSNFTFRDMHWEILEDRQVELSQWLKKFRNKFYLVGGTAIVFHIGHRRSIDFDLFTIDKINVTAIRKAVVTSGYSATTIHSASDQIHFLINDVKLTFFEYPFSVEAQCDVKGIFRMPHLLSLSAMKAFALGGRGKWKDYLDLYYILKYEFRIKEVLEKAVNLFTGVFNPSLFISSLAISMILNIPNL